jgi:hypothetical protein
LRRSTSRNKTNADEPERRVTYGVSRTCRPLYTYNRRTAWYAMGSDRTYPRLSVILDSLTKMQRPSIHYSKQNPATFSSLSMRASLHSVPSCSQRSRRACAQSVINEIYYRRPFMALDDQQEGVRQITAAVRMVLLA